MESARSTIYSLINDVYQKNKMSQEQIEELYALDGVVNDFYEKQINEALDELEELKKLRLSTAEEKLTVAIFGPNEVIQKHYEAGKKIIELEAKIAQLRKKGLNFENKLLRIMVGKNPKQRSYPSKETRNKVFLSNIGLARTIAAKYYHKDSKRFEYDDLFQIACEALLAASYYYVPAGTAKFSTYASKCIENKLKREMFPRKQKKALNCGVSLLKEEKDKLVLLRNIFNVYPVNSDMYTFLRKVNNFVKDFNFDEYVAGRDSDTIVRPLKNLRKDEEEKVKERYEDLVSHFMSLVDRSHINSLITDEERNMISSLAAYKNIGVNDLEAWTFQQYINLYLNKLINVVWYLEVEEELIKENGAVPTQDEILEALNKKARIYNSRMKNLTDGYWKSCPRFDYVWIYYNLFNVDKFSERDRDEEENEIIRLAEDNDIVGNLIDQYEDMLSELLELRSSEELYITCHVAEETIGLKKIECILEYGEFNTNDDNCRVYELEELIKLLSNQLDYFETDAAQDLIDAEYKRRKDMALREMKEKNKEYFSINKEIVSDKRDFMIFGNHKRKFTTSDLEQAEENIQLLYVEDDSLISSKREKTLAPLLSLEDEALINVFMQDYYAEVDKLSDIQKNVLLCWFDDNGLHSMGAKEIGERLNITPRKVYSEKEKALKKLAKSPIMKSYNDV